jgi:CRP-like cAMP-binding protein
MGKSFAEQLVRNRFQSKKAIRRIIDVHEKERRIPPLPKYLSGTHKGVFYRIKVPPRESILPNIPKLPSSITSKPPQLFKKVGRQLPLQTPQEAFREAVSRFQEWFSENWSVLVFNCGSICTLVGFTRSDVLELRVFSTAGSITGVIYNLVQMPRRWPPVLWGLTFGSVNMWKIFQIMRERVGTVHLTAEEENIYINHFLPHGVTPKQFEAISHGAKTLRLKKGSILLKVGDKQDRIYLVVEGSTRASVFGRHVTAASTSPTAHQEKRGGASGAWVGEIAFLENYWLKEQGKQITLETEPEKKKEHADNQEATMLSKEHGAAIKPQTMLSKKQGSAIKPRQEVPPQLRNSNSTALYTIYVTEDCTILHWSHADMEALMERSTDMRAAMTRAMAAAIVAKVVNFTVSRSTSRSWIRWLEDWKNVGVHVDVENEYEPEGNDSDSDDPDEKLPAYPIKKFQ